MSIDWSNPKSKISNFFTVSEATFLPKLKEHYIPTEEEKQNILKTALVMDKVRELLNAPITVSIWIRPKNHVYKGPNTTVMNSKNQEIQINTGDIIDYNALIGGAKNSSHVTGQAVDFVCRKYDTDAILDIIQPKCEELQFALENNGSIKRIKENGEEVDLPRNWIHLQTRPLAGDKPWRMFNVN